jgi:peptidoglycan/xylan/chitin deacetylase (PgdA/CDA1 family)
MRPDATLCLMYHELKVEGRPLCQSEAGYARYVVHATDFHEQMNWLQSAGLRGVSVSNALDHTLSPAVALTFDDGCETDLIVAAPILHDMKFAATFYITVGFLGRRGYMIPPQVRELSDAGFEIGCHSMTHPYLNDLSTVDLHREIVEAKTRLEEITGRAVKHFSCPGGRWSPRVAELAHEAGYRSVATSRIGVNGPASDPFQLARIAVMRGLTLDAFKDLCRGHGLWQRQLRDFLQAASHQFLGNAMYDRVRSLILERRA